MARPVFRYEGRVFSRFRPPSQRRLRYGAVSVFPHRTAVSLLSRGSKIPLPERPPLFIHAAPLETAALPASVRPTFPADAAEKTTSPSPCRERTHKRLRPVSCSLPEKQDLRHPKPPARRRSCPAVRKTTWKFHGMRLHSRHAPAATMTMPAIPARAF